MSKSMWWVLLPALVLAGCGSIRMPPARYDHKYAGKLNVVEMPLADLQRLCMNGNAGLRGCAFRHSASFCQVLLMQGMDRATRAQALQHEIGHCNGWTAAHES